MFINIVLDTNLKNVLENLFIETQNRLINDLNSFPQQIVPLTAEKKLAISEEWSRKLTDLASSWMNHVNVLSPILDSFGAELNSKCYSLEYVKLNNIKQLYNENFAQKVRKLLYI